MCPRGCGAIVIVTDLDFAVGAQLFSGFDGSEYGVFHTLSYAQLQWFF